MKQPKPYTFPEFYRINRTFKQDMNVVLEPYGFKCLGFYNGVELIIEFNRDDIEPHGAPVLEEFKDWLTNCKITCMGFALFASDKDLRELVDVEDVDVEDTDPFIRAVRFLRVLCELVFYHCEKKTQIDYYKLEKCADFFEEWMTQEATADEILKEIEATMAQCDDADLKVIANKLCGD